MPDETGNLGRNGDGDGGGSGRRDPRGPRGALSGRDLLILQLLARGYTGDQLARLYGADALELLWDSQRVLTVLGAPTVRDGVAEARRLGLID